MQTRFNYAAVAPGVYTAMDALERYLADCAIEPMLIHHGALDKNLMGGYPAQEAELKKNKIRYEGHIYPDSVHGS